MSYSFVSPHFAYSLRCALCRQECAHTLEEHRKLFRANWFAPFPRIEDLLDEEEV